MKQMKTILKFSWNSNRNVSNLSIDIGNCVSIGKIIGYLVNIFPCNFFAYF